MSETLGQKQRRFTLAISHLIIWAYANGYEMTEGDAYRDERVFGKPGVKKGYGRRNSNHKRRLARDLNLFKNGVWLTKTEDHRPIGEQWESMGEDHVWGGHFDDGNHYSIKHDGFK